MQHLLDLSDINLWLKFYKKLPRDQQEIFCRPEYYRIFQNRGPGEAKCFIYESGDEFILYPFLLNQVNTEFTEDETNYFDIQGAYGYNGVYYNSDNPGFILSFHKAFLAFCEEAKIIAEFVRFNPVRENHTLSGYLNIIHANDNIIVHLSQEDLWHTSYEYSTRKNINKASRSGLSPLIIAGTDMSDEWIRIFYDIYSETMVRNKAESFYFFDVDLFRELAAEISDNVLFYFILNDKSQPISAELILYNEFAGYSFLGGTLPEFYPYRPNDLIKHTIIQDLKSRGLRYFCLGGGVRPDDGIFRFKKTFSKNGTVRFYIGKKVYNTEIYNRVIHAWESGNPEKMEKYKDYLLKYQY